MVVGDTRDPRQAGGIEMKTYVITTGIVFGLLTAAHIWRVAEEGRHLATEPSFVIITAASTILCVWACRLVFRSRF